MFNKKAMIRNEPLGIPWRRIIPEYSKRFFRLPVIPWTHRDVVTIDPVSEHINMCIWILWIQINQLPI